VLGYTAAHLSAAVTERTDRAFVRVYGRDPVRMLQGLISNDLARADGTRAVYAAVLTPKGKMVCDVRVLRRGDELLVETDATAANALIAHLKKFVPPLFARFDDVTPQWSVLGLYGPDARRLLVGVSDASVPQNPIEDDAHPITVDDGTLIAVATSHTVCGGSAARRGCGAARCGSTRCPAHRGRAPALGCGHGREYDPAGSGAASARDQ
jgi:folate-binding Fe-S cluster repair protein YgfZ